ncbi:MAG: (4Fe-4S)-binding protein [Pseudomonadota bacterium]
MKITWDQNTCIHAGKCVQGSPNVFKIEDGQFVIDETGAPEEEIRATVASCPSGALKIEG